MNADTSHTHELTPFADRDLRTGARLIEAAGIVFSEKGFDRATAKEISELARTSPAAVNYHFGGKRKLYVQVLREAHRRFMNIEALQALAEDEGEPAEGLRAFLSGLLHSMLDPSPEKWTARLIMREMSAPTTALNELVELQVRPVSLQFRSFIGRFMGLPANHPSVLRVCLSCIGQCLFLFQNRRVIQTMFPELDLTQQGIDEMADHAWRFTVAGLGAVAREAAKESGA